MSDTVLRSITSVTVGDDATSWNAAGFNVDGGVVGLGTMAVHCAGDGGAVRWSMWCDDADVPSSVDGISTTPGAEPTMHEADHPNRVVGVDHLVLGSPGLDRTTTALESVGLDCRRVRDAGSAERPMQQRFFRAGPVILELVGSPEAKGGGPASIWGFAFVVDDLDAAVDHLGDACGPAKEAVQPGRRIATVRTRDLGIGTPIALMTPEPSTAGG